jgi:hypothetical protein
MENIIIGRQNSNWCTSGLLKIPGNGAINRVDGAIASWMENH